MLTVLYEMAAFGEESAIGSDRLEKALGIGWHLLRKRVTALAERGYLRLISQRHLSSTRIRHEIFLKKSGIDVVLEKAVKWAVDNSPRTLYYYNFDLSLDEIQDKGMAVTLLHSPVGACREIVAMPSFGVNQLGRLSAVNSESGASHSQHSLSSIAAIIGESLFPGRIRESLLSSLAQISTDLDNCLRIRIQILDPSLRDIPWELAFVNEEYLSLSPRTPIIRYIETRTQQTLSIEGPIRILGIVSNPIDLPEINVEIEKSNLETALDPLLKTQVVDLTWMEGSRIETLQSCLRQDFHVIHYVGHGYYDRLGNESALIMTQADGTSELLPASVCITLLRDSNVRFVFLNSCDSGQAVGGLAYRLVCSGTAGALGYQLGIEEEVARVFTQTFYQALCDFWPIDAAMVEGRKAILVARGGQIEDPNWVLPILHMRSSDGLLFRRTDH